jgi:hypothetical protein
MDPRRKDPERVRLGRLGALTVHARGRTTVGPARAAWEAKLATEVDPDGVLSPDERERRMQFAMRARMTRLAMARWGNKKAGAGVSDAPRPAVEDPDVVPVGTHRPAT